MSPDKTYIVIINEAWAYQVTVDMNIRNAAITAGLKLFEAGLLGEGEYEKPEVFSVQVMEKRN